ncbi:MAG: Succinoglycan biosynthesis protein exoM, partial [Myxococcaceae bacterium]|nr:Succinoglycan biosynthesis protein exoM [Myxococcaceae bacterium]
VPSRRIAALGSGNSLFRRSCLQGPEPFDPALGLCGGEDSALIHKLRVEGRSLAWCPEARVREFFTRERLTMRYLLKRRFSSGQTRTSLCTSNRPELAKWMMVGLVQLLLGTTLAVAAVPLHSRTARQGLCLASGGLGKLLWMAPFRALHAPNRKKQP